MDKETLLKERMSRVRTAIKRQAPDRVPVVLSFNTFGAFYYGYDLKELYYEKPEIAGEITVRLGKEFPCDGFWSIGNNNHLLTQPLGGGIFELTEAGLQVSNLKCSQMKENEYDEMNADYVSFYRDVIIPRIYANFLDNATQEEALRAVKKSYEYLAFYNAKSAVAAKQIAESGMPLLSCGGIQHPMDIIMDYYRDFRGICADIRRQPEKVKKAINVITPDMLASAFKNKAAISKDDGKSIYWPTHIPTYLNPKQFETFWFPYLKSAVEKAVENNAVINLFMEGDWSAHYDVMQELPDNSGNLIGMHEKCNLKEFKEALGHKMCVAGGLPIELTRGDKERAVNSVKKDIDEAAAGGGLIIGNAAMFIIKNDINPETLKAVIATVKEYGRY